MSPVVDGAQQVEVFGIRHHGPGSARSLLAALQAYEPDVVLVEGPADADPLLPWAAAEDMEPPVALLAYARDDPSRAAFWPFAVFSPEWQAIRWALHRQVPVRFCDLPAAMSLGGNGSDPENPDDAGHSPSGTLRAPHQVEHDPLQLLAAAAGYDDAERWWDDVVESRLGGASPFPALADAMAELRRVVGTPAAAASSDEVRREAYMRQTIRAALGSGQRRLAVVCGAWHAPALTLPLPPAAPDIRALRGAKKLPVRLTWVPWTHERLAASTGYGAGIASPGWYHHLWTAREETVARWFTAVARSLRRRDLPVSTAHVIEAVRLADTLAALRGRALAGLSEVTEATRAVLCDGDEVAVRYVTEELVIGRALGSVGADVPTVPLEADLLAQCRRLRVRRDSTPRQHDLDLRKDTDRARSVLFHRLRLLGLPWVQPAVSDVQGRGTFRETWESAWRPEYSVSLVEASMWGTTVAAAATARLAHLAEHAVLAELTAAVADCLRADLPQALQQLLARLADQAATDTDVRHLMDAFPALARVQRYGDVRRTDTAALREVTEGLLLRICAGLPQIVGSLDDQAATVLRERIDQVHAAVGLLASERSQTGSELRERWLAVLVGVAERHDVNGEVAGRTTRLLVDAGRVADAPVRVHRALSTGVPAAAKAAWVDGFFADGAALLIHDLPLLALVDGWVNDLDPDEFVRLLPLVRRTFGAFPPSERRAIAGRIAATHRPDDRIHPEEGLDLDLAAPALATVRMILRSRP